MVSVHKKGSRLYSDLARSVIEGLGISLDLVKAKRVLVKPNLVTSKPASEGVTVDLDFLGSLVEGLRNVTRAEIVVGENSLINTEEVFRRLGVYGLEERGCRVVNFDKDEWAEVDPPFSLLFKKMLVPKVALDSDVIINVGKMKTHELTGVTLGIKNFFGLLSKGGRRLAHVYGIDRGIVDVYSYFEMNKKVATVIDGMVALSGRYGPIIGSPVKSDRLLAGANTVLVDAAAASMMGVEPRGIGHIRLAAETLKVKLPSREETAGREDMKFEVPPGGKSRFRLADYVYKKMFYKYPVQNDKRLCLSCGRCESICPLHIVEVKGGAFSFDRAACVHCLCCVEACNTGAIAYRMNNEASFGAARAGWRSLKALYGLRERPSGKEA